MLTLRPAAQRGHSDLGWLDSRHTFSFSDYYDPQHMGFASLRVINDDRITGGAGFGTHPHADMEIITYVLEGALAHRDSMGHVEQLKAGELQRMSAGTGLTHSEFNASASDPVHLYQIWILPDRKGHQPSYEQKIFDPAGRKNKWQLVVAPNAEIVSQQQTAGTDSPLVIHQNARIFLAQLEPGKNLEYELNPGRAAWLQLLSGRATVNGTAMEAGDGAGVANDTKIVIEAGAEPAHVMLFDLN